MLSVSEAYKRAGVIWQHPKEFIAFCEMLRAEGVKSVLEIGTGLGGSAFVFGELTDHGRVVTVDFDGQGAARIDPRKRLRQPNPNFVQIIGDSRTDEVQAQIAAYAPFDLVYFDTEHAYADCVDNWTRYAGMASRFIAQHDINMDEVKWPNAGIPRIWREMTTVKGAFGRDWETIREFIDPAVDHRFPRWGGLGVIVL
jgi:cephalosporin hydroxylase